MKNAILIPQITEQNEQTIRLTARKTNGWMSMSEHQSKKILSQAVKVVYLGDCDQDGDMFAIYKEGFIEIYKGHLNNGKY